MSKPKNWKYGLLQTYAPIGVTGLAAAVLVGGVAALSMPALVPSIALGFALNGGLVGLFAASGFTAAYKCLKHVYSVPKGSMPDVSAGAAAGAMMGLMGLFLAHGTVREATRPFDRPVKNALSAAANTYFGSDWQNAHKGQILNLVVPLDAHHSIPIKATVVEAFRNLSATEGYRHIPGNVYLESVLEFSVSATSGAPYTQMEFLSKERVLDQDEINWVVPQPALAPR